MVKTVESSWWQGEKMRRLVLKAMIFTGIMLILLTGCSGAVIRKLEAPPKPIQRPLYSVLPPAGDGWTLLKNNQTDDDSIILFGKSNSQTHTIAFEIKEREAPLRPDTPQKFLELIEIRSKKEYDIARHVHLTISNTGEDRFGPFTVRTHIRAEDLGGVNGGKSPPLVLEGYIYFFLPQSDPSVLVRVMYMERGKAEEMSKTLEQDADIFFQRVILTE
jgi:hypothetical protein